jgi:hypothetical protein
MLPSIASKCTGVEGVEQGFTPVDSVFTALLYSIFTMSSFYRFTTVSSSAISKNYCPEGKWIVFQQKRTRLPFD